MAARRRPPSVAAMTLTRVFAAVVALDLLGVIVAISTGLADLGDAVVLVGTPLSAPFTFVAAQALAVLAATRYRVGAAFLAVLCTISITSGFFDGSFTDGDLTAAHRALQVALGVATVSLGALAVRAALRPRLASAAC
jgi:hypothetical protein